MTDEQKQPRMYSEAEVSEIVRENVKYAVVDVHFLLGAEEFDVDIDDILVRRANIPFAAVAEMGYKECYDFPELLLRRMKAKGLDTTHLE